MPPDIHVTRSPLVRRSPKGFLTTRFLSADILVLVGCWVDTYRPAILCGYHNRSGPASLRIAKDRTPRILQSADVNAATALCSVAVRVSASALSGQCNCCVYRVFDSAWTQSTNGVSSRPDEGSIQADCWCTDCSSSREQSWKQKS